jgi:hypothetical protein
VAVLPWLHDEHLDAMSGSMWFWLMKATTLRSIARSTNATRSSRIVTESHGASSARALTDHCPPVFCVNREVPDFLPGPCPL